MGGGRGTRLSAPRSGPIPRLAADQPAAAARGGDIGVELCRATGGSRFVAAGLDLSGPHAYLDRTLTINPTAGRTRAPLEASSGRVAVRLLVDRTSVEFFVDNGRTVQSHRVFPLANDDGIRLFARGVPAVFRDLTIRELSVGAGERS